MSIQDVPLHFDPFRRSADPALNRRIEALADHLVDLETRLGVRRRQRKPADARKFRVAVEALACNLLVMSMAMPEGRLAAPRAAEAMWSGPDAPKVYGSHFLALLDLMQRPEVELIHQHSKGFRFKDGNSGPTTYTPTPALLDRLEAASVTWSSFTQSAGPALVLKATRQGRAKAVPIPFNETGATRKLRREVEELNQWLRSLPLTLAWNDPRHVVIDENGQPLDPSHRSVRRVFNNASWTQGGRLFGSFWETMPREERFQCLRLGTRARPGGEPVANVDFEQLFPRLAYIRNGEEAPEGDLYDITGDGQCRPGWKKLMNALLFAKGQLKNWPYDTRELFGKGSSLRDCIAAIERKHAPIADQFGTSLGYKLMFMESQMLLDGLKAMRRLGIPALPLHDSVLVGRSDAEEAREILAEAFCMNTDQRRAHIKIDIGE